MASEWKELPLSGAAHLNPSVRMNREQSYPFVPMNSVSAGQRTVVATETRLLSGGARFSDGDTLMARITPCLENGKIARFRGETAAFGSTEFNVIRGRDGISDSGYVYYLVSSPECRSFAISQMSGTTGRQRVPAEALGRYRVPLPPLAEQRAIAHILGTLDDKIELNRQMSATLEAMARALFESWFVRFDPVRAKAEGRDTGLPAEIADLFPDRFEKSEIGEVPKGWTAAPIRSLVTLTKGCSYRSADLADSPKALVTLKSFLRGGGYRRDGLKEFIGPYRSDQALDGGELVIALTDVTQNADVVGCPARIPTHTKHQELVASPDVGILRSDRQDHWRPFVYYTLLSSSVRNAVRSCATGTTVLHLDVKAFGSLPLIVPTNTILAAFGDLVSDMWNREESTSHETETLHKLRDTLLPKLISGDLRVPDAERFLADAGV